MSVIGLPVNLGAVADAADAKDSGGRFSLKTVEVELKPTVRKATKLAADGMGPPATVDVTDYAYRVSATDTKVLVTVEGECGAVDEVPGLDGVRTAPNSATKALVPAKEFKKTFADAVKATKRMRDGVPCKQVLASLSDQVVTFGFTDSETEQVQQTRTVFGKFPPAEGIVADMRKKAAPKVKFAVDPLYLAKLAKIAAGFCDESMRLEVEVYGDNKPIIMTAASQTQKVTMLLMPLAG